VNGFDPEALLFAAPAGGMIMTSNFRNRVFYPAAVPARVLNAAGLLPTVQGEPDSFLPTAPE
jgi:hypothetical protein